MKKNNKTLRKNPALSSAVKEVSDSVTHIAKMNMVSALLSENIGELLNTQTAEIRGVPKK
jgi:hypothetical protein